MTRGAVAGGRDSIEKRRSPAGWALALALVLAPALVSAQSLVTRADALFRAGNVFQAETLYYHAARVEPRSATPRLALGRYLASRGAFKVGAVLLEEARLFGGDRRLIAEHLAPMYSRLGDYKALATLPATPLTESERERAEWLADNGVELSGPDSVVVALTPAVGPVIGFVQLLVGADTVIASIEPGLTGLVLDTAMVRRPGVKLFYPAGAAGAPVGAVAVARDIRFGGSHGVGRSAVPATLAPLGARTTARIGLDVLERFAPTFSAATNELVLRKNGRAPPPSVACDRIPILLGPGGIAVIRDGVHAVSTPPGRSLLGARWTLDVRHGEIVADR
jgi:hypothetical protein